MPDHYAFSVETRRGDLHLIWRSGEGDDRDTFAVDHRRRLLAFHAVDTLRHHCERSGRHLVAGGEGSLDLDAVRDDLRAPGPGILPTGRLLEAWNFFEDLARSVDTPTALPVQGPVHDLAYERFFEDGAAWSDAESAAARGLLGAGLDLWDEAVRDALVPDADLPARSTHGGRTVPPR
ncbi:hypothetical protein ACGFYZ_28435 [Streptomyces sp. NPDC048330]|uniref:hypothetical protein n=1 Tax=Streptomyces sp. NPDC048330 TaxID=3365533 RepID=UPI0037106881